MKTVIALVLFLFLPFQAICIENPLAPIEEKILAGDFDGAQKLFDTSFMRTSSEQQFRAVVSREVPQVIYYFNASHNFNKLIPIPGKEDQSITAFKQLNRLRKHVPNSLHFSENLVNTLNTTHQDNIKKYNELVARLNEKKQADQLAQKRREEEYRQRQNEQKEEQKIKEEQNRQAQLKQQEDESKAYEILLAKEEAEEAVRQKKINQEITAKKKVCGSDYGKIEVGMSLSRVEQCNGKFKLIGQTNRADGIISEYRRSNIQIHIMEGLVVSWSKY